MLYIDMISTETPGDRVIIPLPCNAMHIKRPARLPNAYADLYTSALRPFHS